MYAMETPTPAPERNLRLGLDRMQAMCFTDLMSTEEYITNGTRTGKEVHLSRPFSSVTKCGHWMGTAAVNYQVDADATCERCITGPEVATTDSAVPQDADNLTLARNTIAEAQELAKTDFTAAMEMVDALKAEFGGTGFKLRETLRGAYSADEAISKTFPKGL